MQHDNQTSASTGVLERWSRTIGCALLLLFAGLTIHSMRAKSVTVDEMVYFTAGYYHWQTGDFSFNATNPPLMKLASSLPLLVLEPSLPAMDGDPGEMREIAQWHYARKFLYENEVDADQILFWARIPTVLLGLLLGLGIWRFVTQVYGRRAGLLALMLYALSPNVLAHSRLATQDLALSAGLFFTIWGFWRFLERPSWRRHLMFSGAFGLAVATKTTALFFGPILVLSTLLILWRKDRLGSWDSQRWVKRIPESALAWRKIGSVFLALLAMAPIALLILNASYGFQGTFSGLSAVIDSARIQSKLGALAFLADIPLPLPEPFVDLLRFQASRVRSGSSLYFMGELSSSGWYTLMPFAFLVKTPLASLALMGVAVVGCVRWGRERTLEWLILLSAAFVMALFCYLKSVSVGLRYILPMYPMLFVLVGRLLRDGGWWDKAAAGSLRVARAGLVVLLAWYAGGTLWLHPHYLSHFNESVGGPSQGHKYLADSFLDWGQDLRGLRDYMVREKIGKIRLAYFGSADANYYGIDYDYLPSVGLAPTGSDPRWWYETTPSDLPPFELEGGLIAISATLWAGVFFPGYYEPLRGLEPIAKIGSSILIFDPAAKSAR